MIVEVEESISSPSKYSTSDESDIVLSAKPVNTLRGLIILVHCDNNIEGFEKFCVSTFGVTLLNTQSYIWVQTLDLLQGSGSTLNICLEKRYRNPRFAL